MTRARLMECISILGWSLHQLAEMLDYPPQFARYWGMSAKTPVPKDVGDWLEKMARYHERHPGPKQPDD